MVNNAGADFSLDFKKLVKDVKAELKTIKVEYKVGVVPDQFKTRFKADVDKVLKSIRLEKYVDLKPNLRGFKTAFDDEKRKYFAAHPLTVNVKLVPDIDDKKFRAEVKKLGSFSGVKLPVDIEFENQKKELAKLQTSLKLQKLRLPIDTEFENAKKELTKLRTFFNLEKMKLNVPVDIGFENQKKELAKLQTSLKLQKLKVPVDVEFENAKAELAKLRTLANLEKLKQPKIDNSSNIKSIKETANAFTLAERTSEGFSTSCIPSVSMLKTAISLVDPNLFLRPKASRTANFVNYS